MKDLQSRTIVGNYSDEHILLCIFLAISVIGLVLSYNYPPQTALFPRMTSAVVLIGTVLLLFRDYLPKFLKDIVTQEERLIAGGSEDIQETTEQNHESETGPDRRRKYILKQEHVILTIFIIIYVLVGRVIGLLYASPLFVLSYLIWTRQPLRDVILITTLVVIITILFMEYANVPVQDGLLWDMLL